MDADAIVIGAGAAGLAAARALARRSLRVVLVEARDRVGGRVWSRQIARVATPAELGAEFIHGPARETMALLRAAGTSAVPTGDAAWTAARSGDLQPADDDFVSAAGIFEGALSLPEDESVERYLKRFEGDETKRQTAMHARAFVEGFEAADPAIASARAIAQEWRSGVDSISARPRGGYGPMLERLRNEGEKAGVELRLSASVQRISWRPGAISADVRDAGGEGRTIEARAAIVTLPAGVLRQASGKHAVAFDPELPAPKREALRGIEMGHVVKVVLWFRTAFWERVADGRYGDAAFFRGESQPFGVYWTQFPVRSPVLVAWAGGPRAVKLARASRTGLVERARDGFASMLGAAELGRKAFDGGAWHDWSRDPFARGAYSYVAVGASDARAALGAPVGDALFFAGEATSTDGQGGTVNGALETGERAAAEAARVLEAA